MSSPFLVRLLALLALAPVSPHFAPWARAWQERQPIPSVIARDESLKTLRSIYEEEYAKTGVDDRRSLATTLLGDSGREGLDASARYVLLDQARSLSILGYDLPGAFEAISRLESYYRVDGSTLRYDAVTAISPKVRRRELSETGKFLLGHIESLFEAGDLITSEQLIEHAKEIAKQAKDLDLKARIEAVQTAIETDKKLNAAIGILEKSPDDPDANLLVGSHYCFVEGNFERGVPLIARSPDSELREAAVQDASAPGTPQGQKALGDRWFAWAKKQSGTPRIRTLERARYWYERAAPQLDGLEQIGVERLLADVASLLSALPSVEQPVGPRANITNVLPDPGTLRKYRGKDAQSFEFRVTGTDDGGLWGTDIYSDDSVLAKAAVHAGVLKVGETGIVKVIILPGAERYAGTERYGVVSEQYGTYFGSYRIEPVSPPLIAETSALRTPLRSKKSPASVEKSVLDGLRWLVRHQNPDGSWGATSIKQHCPQDSPCYNPKKNYNRGQFDVGLTGLALLCFLDAKFTPDSTQELVDPSKPDIANPDRPKRHNLGEVVKNALQWLIKRQNQDGSFSQGRPFMYDEALATMALAEAYGLTRDTDLKDPAQRGVEFLQKAQRPSPSDKNGLWGWRYVSRMSVDPQNTKELHDSDTSVTGWVVTALKSAQTSELTVKKESMDGALAFCKWVTGADGLVGYLDPKAAGQTVTGPDDHYAYHPTAMSALGMCIRIFAEHNIDDPFLKLAAGRIIADSPTITEDKLSVDYYYWYYGSLALNQFDGPGTKKSGKYWRPWNKQVNEALTELQDKSERTCQTGGWIFPDRWAHDGGPIYTTAMAIRTLQMSQ